MKRRRSGQERVATFQSFVYTFVIRVNIPKVRLTHLKESATN